MGVGRLCDRGVAGSPTKSQGRRRIIRRYHGCLTQFGSRVCRREIAATRVGENAIEAAEAERHERARQPGCTAALNMASERGNFEYVPCEQRDVLAVMSLGGGQRCRTIPPAPHFPGAGALRATAVANHDAPNVTSESRHVQELSLIHI